MDKKTEAIHAVRDLVWAGFYDAEEIAIIIEEDLGEDRNWLRQEAEKEMARKRAEEATWPATTDCDRLDRVFNTLEAQGILALQDAGLTKSGGIADVTEAYEDAGAEASGIVGFCFYTGQDLEYVMESGQLWLAFGDIRRDDNRGVEIGRRIKHALEDAGFTVEWSGSVGIRILVKSFRWQRRSP